MRIKDVDNVRAKQSKKTDKVKSSPETSFSNYLSELPKPQEVSETSGNVPSVAEVNSILLAQEISQDSSKGSQNKNLFTRGEVLLDQLGVIRDGLLAGSLPADKLKELTKVLNEEKAIKEKLKKSKTVD